MNNITNEDLAEIVRSLLPHVPEVQKIERVGMQPNDVIVFEIAAHLPVEAINRIKQNAEAIWPGHRVVVIDAGIKLKVLRERDVATSPTVEQAASMIRQAMRVAEADGRPDGIEEILAVMVEKAKQEDA
jgi:hypothetical protein